MTTSSSKPSVLRKFQSFAIRIATWSNMAGASVLFALIAIMNADVFARGVLHSPIRGVTELVVFALVLIVFLQLPDVVQQNKLTRSDGFLLLLKDNSPKIYKLLSITINLVATLFFFLAFYAVLPEFQESFESCHFFTPPEFGPAFTGDLFVDLSDAMARCDYFGTPGIFTAPWWPAKLAVLVGIFWSGIILSLKVILPKEQS